MSERDLGNLPEPLMTCADEAEYQGWFDNLPDSLQESTTAEKLETICEYDWGL